MKEVGMLNGHIDSALKGLRSFYERVMGDQKSRKKIAIVAVARKLLSIMRAMLLSGELFNEAMVNKIDELAEAA